MIITKRYDFLFFFDVKDGNPNGDPDAGNQPRIDVETGDGLVTDVCIKRKVRNYIQAVHNGEDGMDIFVKEAAVLNREIEKAYDEANGDKKAKKPDEKKEYEAKAQKRMCEKFYDVRTFGAVLSTGEKKDKKDDKKDDKKAGQVRGPIQFTFSRSVEPIVALEHTITRMAVTNEKDIEKERTMGRKFTVPYGLYKGAGFISPQFADRTGFSKEDLNLFWESMQNMFEFDRSAARGLMSLRRLIIFEHSANLGDRPVHELFARVKCERVTEGPARCFEDYKITVDGKELTETFNIIPAK